MGGCLLWAERIVYQYAAGRPMLTYSAARCVAALCTGRYPPRCDRAVLRGPFCRPNRIQTLMVFDKLSGAERTQSKAKISKAHT